MNDTVTKRDVYEMCSTPGRFSGVLLGSWVELVFSNKKKTTFQKHRNINWKLLGGISMQNKMREFIFVSVECKRLVDFAYLSIIIEQKFNILILYVCSS